MSRVRVGDGTTHLSGVDLLAAEGIFVGTHVGGVLAIPVVLVVGVVVGRELDVRIHCAKCRLASTEMALARSLGTDPLLVEHRDDNQRCAKKTKGTLSIVVCSSPLS